jgi:hypothetical protein
MNKMVVPALLVALGLAFATRPARAMESTDTGTELAVIGFGALDLAFAAADLTAGARGEWRSREYGAVEAMAGGLQVGLCLNQAGPQGTRGAWLFGTGLGTIFLIHGVVTLFGSRIQPEIPAKPGVAGIAPVALADPGRPVAAGVGLFGRF